jgi:hypothetical protein
MLDLGYVIQARHAKPNVNSNYKATVVKAEDTTITHMKCQTV